LLFQPDDIAIQEHFLKEAHPTKTQARAVAEGLYAWSDEGKEVSVRDLALSMALPERRVRVVLSVLEAMGVAKEVKAARWAGVEPRPTRDQIDKAASVFEARRISDRRRLAELLKYMNTQTCRVQMMRAYFGEDKGPTCGLCDSCAGLDSEVFDPGEADARHGLHAATDFHGRAHRRRRRGEKPAPTPRSTPTFPTAIPDLPSLAVPPPWIPTPVGDNTVDESVWQGRPEAGTFAAGEIVLEPGEAEAFLSQITSSETRDEAPADFATGWAAIRDANIRPYVEWVVLPPFSLPVAAPARGGEARPQQTHPNKQNPNGQGGNDPGGGGRRRHRRSRHARNRHGRDGGDRRGPRLPGVYNPGGD
jgi:hypothetical protein